MATLLWKRVPAGDGGLTDSGTGLSDVAVGMISLSGSLIVFGTVLAILLFRARKAERERIELRERQRQALLAKVLSARAPSGLTSTIPPLPPQSDPRSPSSRPRALTTRPQHPAIARTWTRLNRETEKDTKHSQNQSSAKLFGDDRNPRRVRALPPSSGGSVLPVVSSVTPALETGHSIKRLERSAHRAERYPAQPQVPVAQVVYARLANRKSPHPNLLGLRSSWGICNVPRAQLPCLPLEADDLTSINSTRRTADIYNDQPRWRSGAGSHAGSRMNAMALSLQTNIMRSDDNAVTPDSGSDTSDKAVVELAHTISDELEYKRSHSKSGFRVFRESSRLRQGHNSAAMPLGRNDFAKGFNPLQIKWGKESPHLPPLPQRSPPPPGADQKVVEDSHARQRLPGTKSANHPHHPCFSCARSAAHGKALPCGPRPMASAVTSASAASGAGGAKKRLPRQTIVRLVKEDSFTTHQMTLARQPDLSPIASISDLSNTPGLTTVGEVGRTLDFRSYTLSSASDDPVLDDLHQRSSPRLPSTHSRTGSSRLSHSYTPHTNLTGRAELEDTSPTGRLVARTTEVSSKQPSYSVEPPRILSRSRSTLAPTRLPPLQLSSHDPPSLEHPVRSDTLASSLYSTGKAECAIISVTQPSTWGSATVRKGSLEDSDFDLATRRSSSATRLSTITNSRAAAIATVRSSVIALRRMNSASSLQPESWSTSSRKPDDRSGRQGGPLQSPSPSAAFGRRLRNTQQNGTPTISSPPVIRSSREAGEQKRERRRQRFTKWGEMRVGQNGVARWESIGRGKIRDQGALEDLGPNQWERTANPSAGLLVDRSIEGYRPAARRQSVELTRISLEWRNQKMAT